MVFTPQNWRGKCYHKVNGRAGKNTSTDYGKRRGGKRRRGEARRGEVRRGRKREPT